MYAVETDVFRDPDLKVILEPGERLLWSGRPAYGRGFFQAVGQEKIVHAGSAVFAVFLWASLPLIQPIGSPLAQTNAIWAYSAVTLMLVLFSFLWASHRRTKLRGLAYFVTDRRCILSHRVKNESLVTRVEVISCPHSATYPYSTVANRPYPSLQIGTMLSYDLPFPVGSGLSLGLDIVVRWQTPAPVVFEQVPEAEKLLETILSCVAANPD